MAREGKNTTELVPWRRFSEMPLWEREMQSMFGDFFESGSRALWDEGADRGEACGPKSGREICEEKDEIATKAELVKVRLRGAQ